MSPPAPAFPPIARRDDGAWMIRELNHAAHVLSEDHGWPTFVSRAGATIVRLLPDEGEVSPLDG